MAARLSYQTLAVDEFADATRALTTTRFHGLGVDIYPATDPRMRLGLGLYVGREAGGDVAGTVGFLLGFLVPGKRATPFFELGVHTGAMRRAFLHADGAPPSDSLAITWGGGVDVGVDVRIKDSRAVTVALGFKLVRYLATTGAEMDALEAVKDTALSFKLGFGF